MGDGTINFDLLYQEVAFFPILGQSNVYNLSTVPSKPPVDAIKECRQYQKHDLIAATLLSGRLPWFPLLYPCDKRDLLLAAFGIYC